MTETYRATWTSPEAILKRLTERASPRKLRLYAVACCRRIWPLILDERCRHAVEVAQRLADGRANPNDLEAAGRTVAGVARTDSALGAAWAVTQASAWVAAWDAAWDARHAVRGRVPGTDYEKERLWQGGMLCDLVGDPARPARVEAAWLTHDVLGLARVVYDEARYGDLPILGDALLDAGCGDEAILAHCRSREPHYRGCWVVDALLGFA